MGALTNFLILTIGLVAANAQYSSSSCGSVPNGGVTANSQDCTGYLLCSNGQLQSQSCPSSYTFDSSSLSCGPNSNNNNCANQNSQYPQYGYPNTVNNPQYGYPTNVNNPQYGYPSNVNNPQYGYPTVNNPQYGYPTNVNNPQYSYPQYGYPNTVNNPQYGYPTTVNNPQYGYPTNVNNPQYGYPTNVNNPQNGYPSNVNSPPYIQPSPINSNPSPIASNPCSGAADGTYAASSTSCSSFYYCNQGQATAANCPTGYSFDSSDSVCAPSTSCN